MSRLPTIDDDEATGKLKEVYEKYKKARKLKRTTSIVQAFSMKPKVMQAVLELTDEVTFGGSTLGRRWEEMISTAVSSWNHCHY